jgi:hypothetical protein
MANPGTSNNGHEDRNRPGIISHRKIAKAGKDKMIMIGVRGPITRLKRIAPRMAATSAISQTLARRSQGEA